MGWFNPDVSWAELERQMSGRAARDRTANNPEADSAPGYSHKRPAYAAAAAISNPRRRHRATTGRMKRNAR